MLFLEISALLYLMDSLLYENDSPLSNCYDWLSRLETEFKMENIIMISILFFLFGLCAGSYFGIIHFNQIQSKTSAVFNKLVASGFLLSCTIAIFVFLFMNSPAAHFLLAIHAGLFVSAFTSFYTSYRLSHTLCLKVSA